jgi:hypothetical protein
MESKPAAVKTSEKMAAFCRQVIESCDPPLELAA